MEGTRQLSRAVVAALIDRQLLRLAISSGEGGLEATPAEICEAVEELASADASPAWIVWNNTLPGLLSRHLGEDARSALLADRRLVTANSTRPSGRAIPSGSSFRVSGRWSLVSGCELADLFLLHCVVDAATEAPPTTILAFLPRKECRIIDTWRSGGLRGTGSHDVVVDGALVRAERVVSFTAPLQLDGPLYQMPFAALMSAGCAAICLGIARSALDDLIAVAGEKQTVDPGPSLRERSSLHKLLSQLSTSRKAARLLLYDVVRDAWEACCDGRPITAAQRAALWGAALHAARTCKDVVRQTYDAAGTPALYTGSLLERAHRDIHAIGQHIVLSERWDEDAGRVILGLKSAHPMF